MDLLHGALSLAPVLLFLGALVFLDSYQLVSLRSIFTTIGAGCLAAILCLVVNQELIDRLALPASTYSRYVAPLIEEGAKSLPVLYLLHRHKVGFLVDAAIRGFAVGTGFALVENIYYLQAIEAGVFVWVARGFGTAILHGSTVAIFSLISKSFMDLGTVPRRIVYLPGLLVAVGLHSLFNHFVLPPLATALVLFVAFPLLVVIVFERSERATRGWLGTGFDEDLAMLDSIESGEIRRSPAGLYLDSLRHRFPGPVVADMLCFLQIHHELAVRAKGTLIAREAGFDLPAGERVRAKLAELQFLEGSIGKTGLLALRPILSVSGRELWQLYMLRK